jgi:hypothetical protein
MTVPRNDRPGAPEEILWEPQPKQAVALERDEDEILYGGSRGGGKTDAGQAWLLYDTDEPRLRELVIRRNADDLKDWKDRAERMYAHTGAEFVGSPTEIRFPHPTEPGQPGARIRTGHLKDENAYSKYQGHEYQRMLIEELSQIPREKDYLKLIASCRSTVPGLPARIFATTNPDDPGLEWIKARWNIPDQPDFDRIYVTRKLVDVMEDGKVVKKMRRLVFIPAKLEDNPKLMKADPGYVIQLELLRENDPELYEAWRNGTWAGYGVEGAYYRAQLLRAEADGRVGDFPYDEGMLVHTWCDLGIGDAFSILYMQNEGPWWNVIDYDEFDGEGLADVSRRMTAKGYAYGEHFAPHDIRVREIGTGLSRLEVARKLGIRYRPLPALGVEDGINAVRTRFGALRFNREGEGVRLFLKRLRRYRKEFDEQRGVFKNRPLHDQNSHGADALRMWGITDHDFSGDSSGAHQFRPRVSLPGRRSAVPAVDPSSLRTLRGEDEDDPPASTHHQTRHRRR